MTTYSQLVDEMILELRRPDLAPDIRTYVNQTIRELHFTPDRGNAIRYRENRRELSLAADLDTGFTWTIPNYEVFQELAAVRYDSVFNRDGTPAWVQEREPGRVLNGLTEFWYRIGNYIAFAGYGGLNGVISLFYYEYPRRLKYYASALRPAEWDDETGFTYVDPQPIDADEEAERQALVTNWLLLRWKDVVSEGVRAKAYKRADDDSRAKMCYSLYSQLRQGIYTSETAAASDGSY